MIIENPPRESRASKWYGKSEYGHTFLQIGTLSVRKFGKLCKLSHEDGQITPKDYMQVFCTLKMKPLKSSSSKTSLN